MSAFAEKLSDAARLVETRLAGLLDAQERQGTPQRLLDAMRHAVLSGGKRFRPFLVFESAALLSAPREAAVDAAAALECVHCYSLVHDDLPSMDNDTLRRGHPTVWTAFDEWTAILAGDALQTMAFEVLAAPQCHADAAVRIALVGVLSSASGASGMAGGQALDLEAERIRGGWKDDAKRIAHMQQMKTGRLIIAACEMGGLVAGADTAARRALKEYGTALGNAFQVSDDLLDAEAGVETTGKATGKDAAAGKATLVALGGIEAARADLKRLVDEAIAALEPFGAKGETLAGAARFMLHRNG